MANKENRDDVLLTSVSKELGEIGDINSLMNSIEATLDGFESKLSDFDKKIKAMARDAVEKDDEEFEIAESSSSEDKKDDNKVEGTTKADDK